MAYIGSSPTSGSFTLLDSISTSASASFTMQKNSVNFEPQSANHMIVSLNGTIQAPVSSFTVSGSTITFASALTSSDVIDFILVLGNVNDVGTATTVVDSAITKNKLNLISDSSSAGLTVKGDGSSENGTIALNCSSNSHAVKISSPSHASGQSYEMILPATNITAGKFLKVDSVSGSGSTGIGQLSFADAGGGDNTPSFMVYNSSDQSLSSSTFTKATLGGEVWDTDNAFASSKFTVPSGEAGKYHLTAGIHIQDHTSGRTQAAFYKNGSQVATDTGTGILRQVHSGTDTTQLFLSWNGNLAVGDYIELYCEQTGGGTEHIKTGTWLSGFKLIGV